MSTQAAERRIPVGPLAGLAGALLLLVSLFIDWWEGATAFTAFEVLDLLLAALALACIAAHAAAFGARIPGFEVGPGVTLAVGALAFLIVLSQVVNDPPAIVALGRDSAFGIWLAVGGSFLMASGGALTSARIAVAVDPEGERVSKRPRGPVAVTPREPAAARMRRRAAERARAAAERDPDQPPGP